ncbi:MAG: ABC transporter ATP-binding protein [Candidatus Nomurabacteria bacterium]|jgi:putative ABC transport system ATP-binding protein|nr:ABC transporter ATP-binding protein [Candidatus Nomurabacteria bacterium]
MKNKLEVKDLWHTYADGQREVEVLKGVTTTFEAGKTYAIVGESGSGKTTLISLIAALDSVQKGDITFNGKSIRKIGESEFRLRYVNIVFQAYNLIRYMTARENVEVALDFAKYVGDEHARAYELLERVGVKRTEADRLVNKLSGGQQQRVAIARATASEVPIVVADEPTGNLDEKTEVKVLEILKSLANEGKIVIVVTHSPKVASELAATTLRMESGKIISASAKRAA